MKAQEVNDDYREHVVHHYIEEGKAMNGKKAGQEQEVVDEYRELKCIQPDLVDELVFCFLFAKHDQHAAN
jgi:hypothetical protein